MMRTIRITEFRRPLVVALAATLLVGLAGAHDFWIAPTAFQVERDEVVAFDLRIGHPGDYESFSRQADHIERFFAVDAGHAETHEEPCADEARARGTTEHPSVEIDVVGREGATPAGLARFTAAGLQRVAYVSKPSHIELEPATFESYLRDEGLEWVIDERERLGESALPGRELFSRKAITAVCVGECESHYGDPLDLDLELVAARNPAAVPVGESLELRLLRDGEPLADRLVTLQPLDESSERSTVRARTDDDGVVAFEIPRHGAWLVATVDMQRAPAEVREREERPADWISRWATLTFATPAADAVAARAHD